MREIEFRIRDRDKWYYGVPLSKIKNDTVAFQSYDGNYYNLFADATTLGQYTGQEDKNGKKIFDGDLCYYFDSNCDEEDGGLKVVYEYGGYWLKGNGFAISFCQINTNTDVEVIGNIHDNLELLQA